MQSVYTVVYMYIQIICDSIHFEVMKIRVPPLKSLTKLYVVHIVVDAFTTVVAIETDKTISYRSIHDTNATTMFPSTLDVVKCFLSMTL